MSGLAQSTDGGHERYGREGKTDFLITLGGVGSLTPSAIKEDRRLGKHLHAGLSLRPASLRLKVFTRVLHILWPSALSKCML